MNLNIKCIKRRRNSENKLNPTYGPVIYIYLLCKILYTLAAIFIQFGKLSSHIIFDTAPYLNYCKPLPPACPPKVPSCIWVFKRYRVVVVVGVFLFANMVWVIIIIGAT